MKKILIILIAIGAFSHQATAQCMHDMSKQGDDSTNPIKLIKNIGNLHHPVSTKNKEAQRYF